jgi:hypothetical protein
MMEPTEFREVQEDIEVVAHVTLKKEQINREHALQAISDWFKSGANKGAKFLVTRLTGPIAEGSLFGGADISQSTSTGARGSLHSQGGIAYYLDFGEGSHVNFPLEARMDLNSGEVTLNWVAPDLPPYSATFQLAYVERLSLPGPVYFFDTERATDDAVYSFTLVLL